MPIPETLAPSSSIVPTSWYCVYDLHPVGHYAHANRSADYCNQLAVSLYFASQPIYKECNGLQSEVDLSSFPFSPSSLLDTARGAIVLCSPLPYSEILQEWGFYLTTRALNPWKPVHVPNPVYGNHRSLAPDCSFLSHP